VAQTSYLRRAVSSPQLTRASSGAGVSVALQGQHKRLAWIDEIRIPDPF
jgi:hypothetical protein